MGREARCVVRHAGQEADAKALLETDELIVRAPFRLKVPRNEIASAGADGDVLTVAYAGGRIELELGEREAARWAQDIANPKTLADKLGVKPDQRVLLVGAVDRALIGAGREVTSGQADIVFLALDSPADLPLIGTLQDEISPDGAIWVIRPKGQDDLTEAMVIGAGRDARLHDVKIARVSATHTAMKFVIPVERR
ncbi:MAG: hypothetical protein QOI17_1030 [Gaiellales bacterium]|jgi:hypothetical protein|nr:hypothetical protein [Gaiellales bacterium]